MQLDLTAEKCQRVGDVVEDVPGDRCVERPSRGRVVERLPFEPGPIAESGAAGLGPGDHLVGEVDPDHAMTGLQEGLADQAGPAAGVEDQGIRR